MLCDFRYICHILNMVQLAPQLGWRYLLGKERNPEEICAQSQRLVCCLFVPGRVVQSLYTNDQYYIVLYTK